MYDYDNTTGLLDRVRHQVGSHDDDVFYDYDSMGQMIEIDDWIVANYGGTDPLEFVYDGAGRLTQFVDYAAFSASPGFGYEYDGAGRVVKMTDNYNQDITYQYDDARRLTQITAPGAHD